jgi:hypothetical protein
MFMKTGNMANRYVAKPAVFVLEIEQRPVVAFEATSAREARELAQERWLQNDLKGLRSNGQPLWNGKSRLRVGPAVGAQVDEVRSAIRSVSSQDELAIVYLVPLDGS